MRKPLLYCIFFLSGLIAVAYQSIWAKYLGHLLGHAAIAQTLAISAFMLGLGLGSWYAGRNSAMSARTALYGYIIAEIGIAVWAFFFHDAYIYLSEISIGSGFLQYLAALVLIVPPASAMGATFPLFWRGVTESGVISSNKALPGLYFVNALGGSLGALLATFQLVPRLGLPGSIIVLLFLNVLIALLVYILYVRKFVVYIEAQKEELKIGLEAPVTTFKVFATIAAITGATSLIYQVIWFRMIALALGSSQHSFEIVLAVFIFALAIGALVLSRVKHFATNTIIWCGIAQVAMGCSAILSFCIWYWQFPISANIVQTVKFGQSGYDIYLAWSGLISLVLIFPTAFWAGMTLPLLTRSALGFGPKTVGFIYSWNTFGCMVGALLATHFFINNFGIKISLIMSGALDIALGLYLFSLIDTQRAVRNIVFLASAAAFAVSIFTMQNIKENPLLITSGAFRTGVIRDATQGVISKYYRDGKTATINTLQIGDTISVATNGKVDGSASTNDIPEPDEYTMVLTALLGFGFHENPKEAMIVGFGTGISTHTMLSDRRISRLVTVEIEPAIVEAASYLSERNYRAYKDTRGSVVINDVKSFMKVDPTTWDIIISEPSNPWVGGVANLFSKEFYKTVKGKLKPDGVFVQWLQTYEVNDQIVASALLAIHEEFPSIRVFDIGQGDWIIVAKPSGIYRMSPELFNAPDVKADLARVGVHSPDDIWARLVGTEKEIIPIANTMGAPANSDFMPYILVNAPRARFESKTPKTFSTLSAGDLQRVALSSAEIADVTSAHDFTGQKFTLPSITLRTEIEQVLASVDNNDGIYQLHPTAGMTTEYLHRINTCDARGQAQLEDSIYLITSLFKSTISYTELEKILNNGIACEVFKPYFKDTLRFFVAYSKRDYGVTNQLGQQLVDVTDISSAARSQIRDLTISGALISGNCQLANAMLADSSSIIYTVLAKKCTGR